MQKARIVVVTGAAGGIGSLLVARFLANGDTVIATDQQEEALQELRGRQKAAAGLVTVAADISREEDCARLAGLAASEAGRVDVLIHCAGYFPLVSFEAMTPGQWRQVIDINLTGVFLLTHALLPLMKGREWGRIISFGSASVFEGGAEQVHYVSAKAALIGFSRSLARVVGDYGITVNIITPGLTVTPTVRDNFPPELMQAQREARALHRDEAPEDLVGPAFFLASPDADFISGQTLNVDGGKTMY